jgi:heat shock protein 1/8
MNNEGKEEKKDTGKRRVPAVGFDIGTTYCCGALYRNGKPEVINNEQGSRTTPSYVAFIPGSSSGDGDSKAPAQVSRMVGEGAKNQVAMNPLNTLYDVKRLLGRKFSDHEVQQDMKSWPFKVVDDGKDRPMIQVTLGDGDNAQIKLYRPEEISAMTIGYMKEQMEAFLGYKINEAVITVPARFGDAQKRATEDAANIAGLKVLRLVAEPTAACIAFSMDRKDGKERNVLVFDAGGGTFDLSVVNLSGDGLVEVKAIGGDTHLGGEDQTQRLVNFLTKEFVTKYKKDITKSARAMSRLRTASERAKCSLSSSPTATIEIDSLFEGQDFMTTISRSRYDDLCSDLFSRIVSFIDEILNKARLSKSDIDEVLLVGGMTRTPKLQEVVKKYFGGKEPCKGVNPDEAIAIGASIMAAQLTKGRNEETKDQSDANIDDLLVIDVTPLSLGIAESGYNFETIVPRSSTIPCSKSKTFSNAADNQTTVEIEVYEGERALVKDNVRLGKFTMSGIKPGPRGSKQIKVTFDVDANGTLTVSAEEESSGVKEKLVIVNDAGRLSKKEIERMIMDAEKNKAEDNAHKERIRGKNQLESLLYEIDKKYSTLSEQDKKVVDECKSWMNEHGNTASKKELDEKCANIASLLQSMSGAGDHDTNSSSSSSESDTGDKSGKNSSFTSPIVDELD